jgi:acetyltransferase-like isoleucine patch superfamily enzyme
MGWITTLGRRALARLERVPTFATQDVVIGRGVTFGRNVVFHCGRVRIGDGVVIGDDVTVNATTFELGDFGTIYSHCFFPGPGALRIGHNFWLGTASIIDCLGGTTIGNNVGIGAHSQLWTHMVFGDTLAGCRFHTVRPLTVGDDAWFVGHCLVSPVRVGDRSLAMLGSVVVQDMQADHCYGGVPAKDITDRVGPQFAPTTAEERLERLESRLREIDAEAGGGILDACRVTAVAGGRLEAPVGITVFNVADRTYEKTGSEHERRLIRRLLPEIKFVPVTASEPERR